jgi:uncharacterized phiE125 gp8 family phage protein
MLPRRYALTVSTAPTVEPVTRAEAKAHLRFDVADEDGYIDVLIQAAREYAESRTGRAICTQTIDVSLDHFPAGGVIELPRPKLSSVTSITYYDSDNTSQTFSSASYVVDAVSEPGRICLGYGYAWPSTYSRPNAVTIRYVAGYGLAASVPAGIKRAVLSRVGDLFDNRAGLGVGGVAEVRSMTADMLLGPYMIKGAV